MNRGVNNFFQKREAKLVKTVDNSKNKEINQRMLTENPEEITPETIEDDFALHSDLEMFDSLGERIKRNRRRASKSIYGSDPAMDTKNEQTFCVCGSNDQTVNISIRC